MMWGVHFGLNWAAISYASSLLWRLSILATVLYVGVSVALDYVARLKPLSDSNSFPGTSKQYVFVQKAKQRLNDWMPRLSLFVVGYILGQASIFSPIRELHNVEVIGKVSDREYSVVVPARWNPPASRDYTEVLKLCADGDDLPLTKGMVIEPFQYIQKADCVLVNANTYVDWKRDDRDNVVDKNGKVLFAKER